MPYEDTGLGGTSGLGGVVATHDESLVSVVKQAGRRRRKYAVVCPHAGKGFCFNQFKRTLFQLPLADSHVLLYDNSRSEKHSVRLEKLSKSLPAYTLVRDDNQPESIESTVDFKAIIDRCSAVYQNIYENYLPEKSDYVVNLEDDVLAPKGSFDRLSNVLHTYSNVGTVVPNCYDRRSKVTEDRSWPIVVNFTKQSRIGGNQQLRYDVDNVEEQSFGVEAVGAAHMGLWLSRRECVDAVGMRTEPHSPSAPMGHDIQYGLRLNESGWKFVVDWSIKLDHYYMQDGTKLCV